MSKLGYATILLILAALTAYVVWPTQEVIVQRLVEAASAPKAFVLRTPSLEQRVEGEDVTIGVLKRKLDHRPLEQLWTGFRGLTIDAKRKVENVGEKQVAAYGLDGTRELAAADGSIRLRWGQDSKTGYVWNGATSILIPVAPALIATFDSAAGRLDQRQLIDLIPEQMPGPETMTKGPPEPRINRLVINGLDLTKGNDRRWRSTLEPQRPPFDSKLAWLIGLMSSLKLDRLEDTSTAMLPPLLTIGISEMPDAGPSPHQLTFFRSGPTVLCRYDQLPSQILPNELAASLDLFLKSLQGDQLINASNRVDPEYLERIEFTRGGQRWYELIRASRNLATEVSIWDLAWAGGRERARDDTAQAIARILGDINTTGTTQDAATAPAPSTEAMTVTLSHHRMAPVTLVIDGAEARSGQYRGRLLERDEVVRSLSPEFYLDRRLIRRSGERVVKFQRILRGPAAVEETYSRSEGSSWRRTHPAGNSASEPDSAAIDRLVRAVCLAQVSDLKLEGQDRQADLQDPTIEIDLRFAAVPPGEAAASRQVDLDETLSIDWGLALKREDGKWRGVDKETGRRFTLADDQVEELLQPADRDLVFPVLGGVAQAASVVPAEGQRVSLARNGDGWTVTAGNDPARNADPVAIRRWFRDLGALKGTVDPKAAEPTPKEVTATIAVTVPGLNRDSETMTLKVLGTDPKGIVVYVASNKPASRFPRGRAVVAQEALAPCLAPATAFIAR